MAFTWPDPPSFSISTPRISLELLSEVLSFNYVAPAHLMQLSLFVALIETLARIVLVVVTSPYAGWRVLRQGVEMYHNRREHS